MEEHLFALKAKLAPWWNPSIKARRIMFVTGLVTAMITCWMSGVVMGSGALTGQVPGQDPWRLLAGMCVWWTLSLFLMLQAPTRSPRGA